MKYTSDFLCRRGFLASKYIFIGSSSCRSFTFTQERASAHVTTKTTTTTTTSVQIDECLLSARLCYRRFICIMCSLLTSILGNKWWYPILSRNTWDHRALWKSYIMTMYNTVWISHDVTSNFVLVSQKEISVVGCCFFVFFLRCFLLQLLSK